MRKLSRLSALLAHCATFAQQITTLNNAHICKNTEFVIKIQQMQYQFKLNIHISCSIYPQKIMYPLSSGVGAETPDEERGGCPVLTPSWNYVFGLTFFHEKCGLKQHNQLIIGKVLAVLSCKLTIKRKFHPRMIQFKADR